MWKTIGEKKTKKNSNVTALTFLMSFWGLLFSVWLQQCWVIFAITWEPLQCANYDNSSQLPCRALRTTLVPDSSSARSSGSCMRTIAGWDVIVFSSFHRQVRTFFTGWNVILFNPFLSPAKDLFCARFRKCLSEFHLRVLCISVFFLAALTTVRWLFSCQIPGV